MTQIETDIRRSVDFSGRDALVAEIVTLDNLSECFAFARGTPMMTIHFSEKGYAAMTKLVAARLEDAIGELTRGEP